MPALSKLARSMGMDILTTNCYETIHTWEPDCNKAVWAAVPNSLWFSFKTYASFYCIANIISKQNLKKIDYKRLMRDIIQSSLFLTTNLVFWLIFLCKFRHWLGFFTPYTLGWISSTLASFVAILVEKKNRRPALALYLTNLASETLYRQGTNHGYCPSFKRGETVPFAVGLGLFFYLYSKDRLNPSFKKLLNFTHHVDNASPVLDLKRVPTSFRSFLTNLRNDYSKSSQCNHNYSCISHISEATLKNFGIGLMASSALTLMKNLKNIVMNPAKVIRLLCSKQNFRIPLFFSLMPLLYHSSTCVLNRISQSSTVSTVVSGTISGLAMSVFPNVTIAMYTLWKAIETVYFDLVKQGYLPLVPHGDIILYAISTGYVLWMPIIEPQAVRKGYLNFLIGLTGNRLKLFNHTLYEHFGFQSNLMYPADPVLDGRFCTINPALYQAVRGC